MRNVVLILLGLLVLFGCTRDDICDPAVSATTPLLIITFKDIGNPTEAKSVTGLEITTTGLEPVVIVSATTDSISIPLNINDNTTQFNFTSQSNSETPNTDLISINYTRNDIYVNRACAFRTIFENLGAEIENDTLNWMFNAQLLVNNVENTNEAHITILH